MREFSSFKKVAERKLTMLDSASDLKVSAFTTGKSVGDVESGSDGAAQHQDQRSVENLFSLWKADGPYEVEITDYH